MVHYCSSFYFFLTSVGSYFFLTSVVSNLLSPLPFPNPCGHKNHMTSLGHSAGSLYRDSPAQQQSWAQPSLFQAHSSSYRPDIKRNRFADEGMVLSSVIHIQPPPHYTHTLFSLFLSLLHLSSPFLFVCFLILSLTSLDTYAYLI